MVKVALLARVKAKPGKEAEVSKFFEGALPLAQAEGKTPLWFALKFSESEYGVFDAFADESGRKAHLSGEIAKALMANAERLFEGPPKIEQVEVLSAKVTAA